MGDLLFKGTFLLYLLSTIIYSVFFFSQNKTVRKTARMFLLGAGIFHTIYLIFRYFEAGHTPLTSNHDIVSFFSWAMAWGFLSFRWRYQIKNFGSFVSILITLQLIVAAMSSSEVRELQPELQNILFPIHASIIITAIAFLAMAFCGAIMYLLQERELKSKRFGFFFSRLPSLDALDTLNHHCLSIGFPLLTLGMITGLIWSKQVFGSFWSWDPKETYSLITWLLYAAILHQRFTVGWRGRRIAFFTIIGFVVSLITFWVPSYHFTGL